jgi:hypothetical protein
MKSQSSFIAAAIAGVFAAGTIASQATPVAGVVTAEEAKEKEGCPGKDKEGCPGKKKEEKKGTVLLAEKDKDKEGCPGKDKEGCPGKKKEEKKEGTIL